MLYSDFLYSYFEQSDFLSLVLGLKLEHCWLHDFALMGLEFSNEGETSEEVEVEPDFYCEER